MKNLMFLELAPCLRTKHINIKADKERCTHKVGSTVNCQAFKDQQRRKNDNSDQHPGSTEHNRIQLSPIGCTSVNIKIIPENENVKHTPNIDSKHKWRTKKAYIFRESQVRSCEKYHLHARTSLLKKGRLLPLGYTTPILLHEISSLHLQPLWQSRRHICLFNRTFNMRLSESTWALGLEWYST